jgi:hypothetical protein
MLRVWGDYRRGLDVKAATKSSYSVIANLHILQFITGRGES